jgi:hypothetical protein
MAEGIVVNNDLNYKGPSRRLLAFMDSSWKNKNTLNFRSRNMAPFSFKYARLLFYVSLIGALQACSLGVMKVDEVHYWAVSNGVDTNYYRLSVDGYTRLSDAEYRSGWFDATAVDSLFGDVSEANAGESAAAKAEIEALYREAYKTTTENWLNVAKDPNKTDAEVQKEYNALRRIKVAPYGIANGFENAVEVEYNPTKGVMLNHSGEKMVFLLSANPDQIVGNITNFAESEKTAYMINKLGKVVELRAKSEIKTLVAEEKIADQINKVVVTQLQSSQQSLKDLLDNPIIASDANLRQIDAVLGREIASLKTVLSVGEL